MKLIIRASAAGYRDRIQDEDAHGRLAPAWLTFGHIPGRGWAFLAPWAQQALFPEKGRSSGIGHPARVHEPFWILRLWPRWESRRHVNHEEAIAGYYWRGLAWRERWGWRSWWRIRWPAVRWVVLDPDR